MSINGTASDGHDPEATGGSWEAPRLSVEMIPRPIFGENLRNRLSHAEWERCKDYAKAESGGVCGICSGAGARGRVDCHERWEWNETVKPHVQKLIGLIALCPRCHGATHFGRALVMGFEQDAIDQLMQVNGWSRTEAKIHVDIAMAHWKQQNEHAWELNLSWLKETLGIEPGEPRPVSFPGVAKPPQLPATAAERFMKARNLLEELREGLKQANYRVKYASTWMTKIAEKAAGEERLAAAKMEAKQLRKQVASQKVVVLDLEEELEREQKAVTAAKYRARRQLTSDPRFDG